MGQIANIGGRIAGITITPSGALVEGIPLEHTYEECMRQITVAEKACKFVLGDLINSASKHYGEKYAKWAEVTGFEIQSLRDIASTCSRVSMEHRRVSTLTFIHHREVAKLPPAEQKNWLEKAEESTLDHKRLRKSIQLGRIATAVDMGGSPAIDGEENDTGYENVHPFVNRIVTYLSKKERDGEYEDLDAEGLYRFHLDLLPAINRWGAVVKRIRKTGDAGVIERLDRDLENVMN